MWTALLLTAVSVAAPPENIYRSLHNGDWVEFKSINGLKETVVSRQTVIAKSENEITLRLDSSINGKSSPPVEQKINLRIPYDPEAGLKDLKDIKASIESLGTGKETVTIGGRTYDCQWEKKMTTFTYDNPQIPKTEIVSKRWWSSAVPFGGTVKVETTMAGVTTVTELAGFGTGK